MTTLNDIMVEAPEQKYDHTIKSILMNLRLSGSQDRIALANAMLPFKIIETRRIPTAGTDGIVMCFNPDFVSSLPFEQVVGLIVHELMHARLNHAARFDASIFDNHTVSNMAMDDSINPMVATAGFELPPDGCWPEQHGMEAGRSWEVYYPSRLAKYEADREQAEKDREQAEGGDESGESVPGDGSGDESTPASSGDSPASDDGDESGPESPSNEPGDTGDGLRDEDENDSDADATGGEGDDTDEVDDDVEDGCHPAGELAREFAPELLEGDGDETPQEKAANNAKASQDRLQQTRVGREANECEDSQSGSGQGKGSGGREAGPQEPVKLDVAAGERWQEVVIDTLRPRHSSKTDWSRRSRRMQPTSVAYIPGRKKVNGLSLALILDCSGSCTSWFPLWQALVNELIEEVPQVQRLDLIYHDDCVLKIEEWSKSEGDVELEMIYGGGTCHVDALAAIDDLDVDAIIQFTDNATTWPTDHPDLDCVTVMPPRTRRLCPFGVNVQATAEDN